MELRAFIQLFIREKNLILTIALAALVISIFAYRLQGQWYQGEVLLSVTREAPEATVDYRYDQLYRLQADERMADTISHYLESEAGREEVAEHASLTDAPAKFFVKGKVQALRLSSQLIQVRYRAKTPIEAERLASALLETGERYMASLNEQAQERNWFTLIVSDTVVKDGRFTLPLALAIGLGIGLMVAFWTVLIIWYWRGQGQETGRV